MEDDKRRRKNKKKKNKQSKNVENGVGETAARDQNLVNNGKDEPAQLLGTADEQSVSVDRNGVVEVPNRDLVKSGKDEPTQPLESADGQSTTNMDSNGHLPNGKECVSFPSINIGS